MSEYVSHLKDSKYFYVLAVSMASNGGGWNQPSPGVVRCVLLTLTHQPKLIGYWRASSKHDLLVRSVWQCMASDVALDEQLPYDRRHGGHLAL